MSRELEVQKLQKEWDTNPRWKGIKRGYTAEDVVRLRGAPHFPEAPPGQSPPRRLNMRMETCLAVAFNGCGSLNVMQSQIFSSNQRCAALARKD